MRKIPWEFIIIWLAIIVGIVFMIEDDLTKIVLLSLNTYYLGKLHQLSKEINELKESKGKE